MAEHSGSAFSHKMDSSSEIAKLLLQKNATKIPDKPGEAVGRDGLQRIFAMPAIALTLENPIALVQVPRQLSISISIAELSQRQNSLK